MITEKPTIERLIMNHFQLYNRPLFLYCGIWGGGTSSGHWEKSATRHIASPASRSSNTSMLVSAGASDTADTLFQEVLGRKDKADSTRNALNVLQRFKFLFNLPLNIERNIQKVPATAGASRQFAAAYVTQTVKTFILSHTVIFYNTKDINYMCKVNVIM